MSGGAPGSDGHDVVLRVEDLSFWYPDHEEPCLDRVSLEVRRGDFVLIVGPSGCGKSTLLKCLTGIIPNLAAGRGSGSVVVDGLDTRRHKLHQIAEHVGLVLQNPDDQIFSLTVADEVAFGPENLGLAKDVIVERVHDSLRAVGAHDLLEAPTMLLSGGQKQRVATAGALALRPRVLVCDEPTTDLDPVGKAQFVGAVDRLRRLGDLTFVVAEHALDDLLPFATRLIAMDRGRVVLSGEPADLLANHGAELRDLGVRLPAGARTVLGLDPGGRVPLDLPGQIERIDRIVPVAGPVLTAPARDGHERTGIAVTPVPADRAGPSVAVAELEHVSFWYKPERRQLDDVSFSLREGEMVALVGPNGAGKSTLVKLLVGLLRPKEGRVRVAGEDIRGVSVAAITEHVGFLFQNPDHQIFMPTVRAELEFSLRARELPREEKARRVDEVLATLGLSALEERHPYQLSRGQRKRLAVATVLVHHPRVILLDEPTTGQDGANLDHLLDLIRDAHRARRGAVLMITHDMEVAAQHADRVVCLRNGAIAVDAPPQDVFRMSEDFLTSLSIRLPEQVVLNRALRHHGVDPAWDFHQTLAALRSASPGDAPDPGALPTTMAGGR